MDLFAAVDPFIGTGGIGFGVGSTYPGPALPFAMIHPGPDTREAFGAPGFSHCAGYWYEDRFVEAFSLLRMNGTGVPDYGVIGFMPVDGMTAARTDETGYMTAFDHADEEAAPGYYRVTLANGITVELTSTLRAAIVRITYPEGVDPTLVFDLEHTIGDGESLGGGVALAGNALDGWMHNNGDLSRRMGGFPVYARFVAEPAPSASGVWDEAGLREGASSAEGVDIGAWWSFPAGTREVVLRTAVSFVDADGARQNLAAEVAELDFDTVRADAEALWRRELAVMELESAHDRDATLVATSLYRSLLMPTLISDADGRSRDATMAIMTTERPRYSDFSMWDTYRTTHPWLVFVDDPRNPDFATSLVQLADGGGALPRWSLAHGDIGSMIGSPADMILSGMAQKGVVFDEEAAYDYARITAMGPPPGTMGGRRAITDYLAYGYVPSDLHTDSVAKTTEYATADHALSLWAARLGRTDDAAAFAARASAWRQLYDPDAGFLVPRRADGSWDPSYTDPTEEHHAYTEGTAWQYLWMVPHDLTGLADALGGREAGLAKLRELFAHSENEVPSLGMRFYYWQGNEPDIIAPWGFAALGEPAESVRWIDWVLREHYGTGPDGLPGNDDGGTMSAWVLFAAAGVYPIAGTDRYIVAAPRQKLMVLSRPGGTLRIEADPDPRTHPNPLAVTLDGVPVTGPELRHEALSGDHVLRFTMGE